MRFPKRNSVIIDQKYSDWGVWHRGDAQEEMRARDRTFELACKCVEKKETIPGINKRPIWASNKETRRRGSSWVVNHDPNHKMALINSMIIYDFPFKWQAVLYLRFASNRRSDNKKIALALDLQSADYVSKIFSEIYWYTSGVLRQKIG